PTEITDWRGYTLYVTGARCPPAVAADATGAGRPGLTVRPAGMRPSPTAPIRDRVVSASRTRAASPKTTSSGPSSPTSASSPARGKPPDAYLEKPPSPCPGLPEVLDAAISRRTVVTWCVVYVCAVFPSSRSRARLTAAMLLIAEPFLVKTSVRPTGRRFDFSSSSSHA